MIRSHVGAAWNVVVHEIVVKSLVVATASCQDALYRLLTIAIWENECTISCNTAIARVYLSSAIHVDSCCIRMFSNGSIQTDSITRRSQATDSFQSFERIIYEVP